MPSSPARAGDPKLTGSGGTFAVTFHDATPMDQWGSGGVAQLLTWLDPDALIEKFEKEIDLLPTPSLTLTAKEKER